MNQDILTYIAIIIATGVVIYRIVKPYIKKQTSASSSSCCSSSDIACSGCAFKQTCKSEINYQTTDLSVIRHTNNSF